MEVWRKIIHNLGKILQEIEISSLANGILSAIGSIISIYVSGLSAPLIFQIPAIVFLLVCFYIIIQVFIKMLNRTGEKLIKISEKWYPGWLYRPKFSYYLQEDHNRDLTLYIKSSSKNKKAHLRLDFHRVKLLNGNDEQKKRMDIDFLRVGSKTLYDKEIAHDDKRTVTISSKTTDGRVALNFPYDKFGIALFPGNYVYQFQESGTHKGVHFYGKTQELEFIFTEQGNFEIRQGILN